MKTARATIQVRAGNIETDGSQARQDLQHSLPEAAGTDGLAQAVEGRVEPWSGSNWAWGMRRLASSGMTCKKDGRALVCSQ